MRRDHALTARAMLLTAALFGGCGDKPSGTASAELPGQSEFEKAQLERQRVLEEARVRQAAEREKRRAEVEGVGSVKLLKMRAKQGGAASGFDMTIEFTNQSDKELVQADGRIEFYDRSGALLKLAKMPIRESVSAGKSITKKGKFPLSADSKGDATLAGLKPAQVELKWVPAHYRFADGTTLDGVE